MFLPLCAESYARARTASDGRAKLAAGKPHWLLFAMLERMRSIARAGLLREPSSDRIVVKKREGRRLLLRCDYLRPHLATPCADALRAAGDRSLSPIENERLERRRAFRHWPTGTGHGTD